MEDPGLAALSFTPGSIVGASTALLRESRCPDSLPGADLRARSETGMEREWCREQVETRKGQVGDGGSGCHL